MANLLSSSGLAQKASALTTNIQSQISNSISSIGNSLIPGLAPGPNFETGELVYPLSLRGQPNVNMIQFTAHDNRGGQAQLKHLFFPCPAGIAINDSATYNTIDLGAFGGAALAAAQDSAGTAKGFGQSLFAKAKAAKENFTNSEIASAASALLVAPDSVKGAVSLKNRVILNPNTNTTFTGNAVRSFTFAFKMIAESPEESAVVSKIHDRFRKYAYADSQSSEQNMIMSFPPTWTIHFLRGDGQENPFIPKIFSCYLTGVESTFNSTTNMFHADGAPMEVDVSVSYQETRTLTRTDIEQLRENAFGKNRGVDENGVPKISGSNITIPTDVETLSNFDQ